MRKQRRFLDIVKRVSAGLAMTAVLAVPALAQSAGSDIDEYDREMLTSLIEAVIATDEGDFVMTSAIPQTAEAEDTRPASQPVVLTPKAVESTAPATEGVATFSEFPTAPVPQPTPQADVRAAAISNLPDAPASEMFALQLASYGSAANAQRGFEEANKRYAAALTTHTLYVQPVDLGERGVFHRLRIGGYASVSDASEGCQALGIAIDNCMIVSANRK